MSNYIRLFEDTDGSYDSLLSALYTYDLSIRYFNKYFSFVIFDEVLSTLYVNITDKEDLEEIKPLIKKNVAHYCCYGDIAKDYVKSIVSQDYDFEQDITYRLDIPKVRLRTVVPEKITVGMVEDCMKDLPGYSKDVVYEAAYLDKIYRFKDDRNNVLFYLGLFVGRSFGFFKEIENVPSESILEALSYIKETLHLDHCYVEEIPGENLGLNKHLKRLRFKPGSVTANWYYNAYL